VPQIAERNFSPGGTSCRTLGDFNGSHFWRL